VRQKEAEDHDPYQALHFGEFRWFLLYSSALAVGTLIQSVVMGWQVWEITHSPLSLGLVGLAEALPCLGFTMLGGYAADRVDRRLQSLLSTLLMLGGAALLFGLNCGGAPHSVWPFYAIQALAGLSRAFMRPAAHAMRAELVPRDALPNAATWNSSSFHAAMVMGPALGGLLFRFGGARIAYGTEALMLVAGLVALMGVKPKPRLVPVASGLVKGLKEGFSFVLGQQVILSAMSLDLFAVLFGGAPALLPIFASEILKVGPQGLGILRAAPAVGSIAMGVALAHLPPLKQAGRTLLASVALFGLCWIFFAFSHTFALSLVLLALSGALDNVSVVVRQTLIQLRTPQELMGRVSAVSSFFITSSNEIGAFESGLAAKLMGLVPSVVFGGLMTLGVVGFTNWKGPELRKLKRM
jgi:MFS family permease